MTRKSEPKRHSVCPKCGGTGVDRVIGTYRQRCTCPAGGKMSVIRDVANKLKETRRDRAE